MKLFSAVSVLLVFFMVPSVNAQISISNIDFAASFRLGPGASWNGGEDAGDNDKFKFSYNIGAALIIQPMKYFSLQPEMSYSKKGWSKDIGNYSSKITLDYIEIPLLVKIQYPIEELKVTPAIIIGPAVGLNIRADNAIEFDINDSAIVIEEELEVKTLELSFMIGGELGFNIGPGMIFGSLRYCHGLTDIYDEKDYYNNKIKNRTFAVLLGYQVFLSKFNL